MRKRDVIAAVKAQAAGRLVRQPRPTSSLVETIARVSGETPQRLDLSANLTTDLKLDSLGRVELMSALEDRYQVELDEAAFTSATTLGDVEKMLHEKATEHARPYPFPEWPLRFPATWIRLFVLYLLILHNAFSLPRESGFRRSFAFAGRAADRGYNLLVFPEGQRTHDGRMNPFMGGTGLMVSGLDMEVVPVKIAGLFELKQRRRYFALPGDISVTFGEPVSYEPAEDPARITEDLEMRVARL